MTNPAGPLTNLRGMRVARNRTMLPANGSEKKSCSSSGSFNAHPQYKTRTFVPVKQVN